MLGVEVGCHARALTPPPSSPPTPPAHQERELPPVSSDDAAVGTHGSISIRGSAVASAPLLPLGTTTAEAAALIEVDAGFGAARPLERSFTVDRLNTMRQALPGAASVRSSMRTLAHAPVRRRQEGGPERQAPRRRLLQRSPP